MGNKNDLIELIVMIFAAVSAFSSSLVLITGLVFPSMRKRMFMRLIMLISLCDTIGSAAVAFGFPPNSSLLCPAQSFLVNFFYKSSWMWSTMLSFQLYGVFMSGKIVLSEVAMHLTSWSVPVISTLLPLSTDNLGRVQSNPFGWCFLSGNAKGGSDFIAFWVVISFFAVLFVCIALMFYFTTRIVAKYRQFIGLDSENREIRMVVESVALYPIAMILCWLPNLVLSLLVNFGLIYTEDNFLIFIITQAIGAQNGTITAILFFYKSKEARYRWRLAARKCICWDDANLHGMAVPLDFPDDDIFSNDEDHTSHSDRRSEDSSVGQQTYPLPIQNLSFSSVSSKSSRSSAQSIDLSPWALEMRISEQRSPLNEPFFLTAKGAGNRMSAPTASGDEIEPDLFHVSLKRNSEAI